MSFRNPILLSLMMAAILVGCKHDKQKPAEPTVNKENDIDNALVFIRHGRNSFTPEWNLLPDQDLRICVNMAEWYARDWGKRFCGKTDAEHTTIRFLEPIYETDLPVDQVPQTDRFRQTAFALQNGLVSPAGGCPYPASSMNTSKMNVIQIPVATSVPGMKDLIARFKKEGKTRKQMIWQDSLQDQEETFAEMISLIEEGQEAGVTVNRFEKPKINAYVLSRSVLWQLARDLSKRVVAFGYLDREVREAFFKEIDSEFKKGSRDEDYFYDSYWVVLRAGTYWVRYETVRLSNVDTARVPRRCDKFTVK